MEQEEDIQSSTAGHFGVANGPNSAAIDRMLRHQDMRLGANIALLEQRYEMLPNPARFQTLQTKHARLSTARRPTAANEVGLLPGLVAQHLNIIKKIETLISQCPDGQRGELILSEIARNHEEMASMLFTLIKEEDAVRDTIPAPVIAAAPAAAQPGTSEANWENEGGAAPLEPAERDSVRSRSI